MKNVLTVLAAIATLALVIDVAEPSSARLPRWYLLLVLAVCFATMAYLRHRYDAAVQQRNEMQDQLVRLLPRYSGRDAAHTRGVDGRPEVRTWAEPMPRRAKGHPVDGDEELPDLMNTPLEQTPPQSGWPAPPSPEA